MSKSGHLRRDCNTLQLTSHRGSIIYLMRNHLSGPSDSRHWQRVLFLSYEALQMRMAAE